MFLGVSVRVYEGLGSECGLVWVWWWSGRGVEGVWRVSGGHLVCVWLKSCRVLEGALEVP